MRLVNWACVRARITCYYFVINRVRNERKTAMEETPNGARQNRRNAIVLPTVNAKLQHRKRASGSRCLFAFDDIQNAYGTIAGRRFPDSDRPRRDHHNGGLAGRYHVVAARNIPTVPGYGPETVGARLFLIKPSWPVDRMNINTHTHPAAAIPTILLAHSGID